jgi:uncharacterized Zn-binding protein involved in type VI secretion
MPPAARVGDRTAHGTPLTPAKPPGGSLDVIIENQPAWLATVDIHTCPLVNGTVPHVGGVVVKGSTSVLINNMPAVRMNDSVVETGGGPNQISSGAKMVVIGG